MKRGVKGQIWVETVLYTLISIALIGLVLAFIVPKVEEIQDKATIEQSIDLLNEIDGLILSSGNVAGNKRILDLSVRKGTLKIDGANDLILFELQTDYLYSEYGEEIKVGDVTALTEQVGTSNRITLTSNQSLYNLTYEGADSLKELGQSSSLYRLSIENKGKDGKTVIDVKLS